MYLKEDRESLRYLDTSKTVLADTIYPVEEALSSKYQYVSKEDRDRQRQRETEIQTERQREVVLFTYISSAAATA